MARTILGLLAAAVVLGAFLLAVDPQEVARLVVGADPLLFAVGFPSVLVALVCRSEAYRRLFGAAGADLSVGEGLGTYGTSTFVKQVVPLGHVGGPAVVAYAYDRATALGYDRAIAVSTVGEAVSLFTSVGLTVLGVSLVASRAGGADGGLLVTLAAILVAGTVAVAAIVLYRRAFVGRLARGTARVVAASVGRLSDRVRRATTPETVDAGVARYYRTVDHVGADRTAVATAVALTSTAWVLYAAPLYLCALAVGVDVGVGVAFVLVPAGGLATVVPLPGGLGGYEVGMTGGMVLLAGVDPAAAAAAVLLYRLAGYWLLVLFGGVAATMTATVPRGPAGEPVVEALDE
jgi:uncharacterized protein (TIRG00374 family)